MSRRKRQRRDRRAPIPDFDEPQPREVGLLNDKNHERQCTHQAAAMRCNVRQRIHWSPLGAIWHARHPHWDTRQAL